MKKKKEFIVSSMLFAMGALIWIIISLVHDHDRGTFDMLLLLRSIIQWRCYCLFYQV